MEKREEILKQRGDDRAAITQSQPVQRIAPDLKAEGYNTSRGYIEKSTGETFFLRIAPDEEVGLGKRVYCLKNEFHYHQCDEDDFKKLFEKA